MRAPRKKTVKNNTSRRSLLNKVPLDVLAAHMLPHMNERDLARWAQVSKATRPNAQRQLNAMKNAYDRDAMDLARGVVTAVKKAWTKPDGPALVKAAVDRLGKDPRFAVRTSRIVSSLGGSFTEYFGSIWSRQYGSRYYQVQIYFAFHDIPNWDERPVDMRNHATVTMKEIKQPSPSVVKLTMYADHRATETKGPRRPWVDTFMHVQSRRTNLL